MVRRALALPVVLVLVFAGLWLAPLRAPAPLDAAQAGTGSPLASPAGSPAAAPDLGFNLPAGITLTPLAAGIANDLPGTPAHLALTRLAVAPHANLGQRQTAGPELVYVESGAIVTVDELGLENTYPQGSQLLLQTGATYTLRNDAAQPASLLRLSLAPPAPPATAPASPAANGTPAAASSETVLVAADVASLPSAPARVFLARATWAPGAALPDHTFTGPVGFLTESGMLTVSRPSGTAGQLPPGKGIVIPPDVVTGERNAGTAPAVTLMFGVVTTTQQAVVPVPTPTLPPTVTPVPTETPIPTETPAPTSTPMETATPSLTATPLSSAGNVLYEANWSNGMNGWAGSGDWKTVDGMLVNDGTSSNSDQWLPAPFAPSKIADYAVEAQIQFVRGEDGFGFVVRATDNGGYRVGIGCGNRSAAIGTGTNLCDRLAATDFDPGADWHTYRVEVRGNTIRLLVDGGVVVETVDNQFLEGGKVGLFSDQDQINVRSFKVIAL